MDDIEIIDEIYSDVIGMDDDYEIITQEINIHSTISSSSSSLSSLSLSYKWIILILLIILISIIMITIKKANNYNKKIEDNFLTSSSLSSLDDELQKLEKELDNDSLSKTFMIRLQIVTNIIIHHTTNTNDDDIIKYGSNLSRIDKILQTLVLPKKRLPLPSFIRYIMRFNIMPLLENRSFKADLDHARDIYEKRKYTNSSENLKLDSIKALKAASLSDNADVIREALAFSKAYHLDSDYSNYYDNAEITLQNLEKIEKKSMIKEKQKRLNEYINHVDFGAQKIKSDLIDSGNNLINVIVKNNDVMLVEMETIITSKDVNTIMINNDNNNDNDNNDNDNNNNNNNNNDKTSNDDPSDIILLNNTNILNHHHHNEQLVSFNSNSNAAVLASDRKKSLVLVEQNGNIISNPDIKQQFALTVHKTETDIINLNKETGLIIVKAVNEYNQTIDDYDRHMEEEWKKCREAARIRIERKISDAKLDDNKFTLALQQNKKLSEKLDMYTNNSEENTYICHQKWKSIQQRWDTIFYIITFIISFFVYIKTSSSSGNMTLLQSLLKSLCNELSHHDQKPLLVSPFCENDTCINSDSSNRWIWWNLDPFRPLSYMFGIAFYNTITLLAYFKLSGSSLSSLKCCLNIFTRIITPLILSFMTYKYANLIQLSKYILVIGICLCLGAPITRFFWPFRNFSYLLLGHTIFHFIILGMDWHLTWTVSFLKRMIDMRWILLYTMYPLVLMIISAYLGCMQYSDSMKNQNALHHSYNNDFYSLTECVIVKLLEI